MANDPTQSLFGMTPEMLQMQRDAQLAEQATAFAKMSPSERATMGFYQSGNRIGGAIGGMLGAEDPTMKLISQRQQILKESDIQSSDGLKALSQKLYAAGDYQGASQALAQAQARDAAEMKQRLDASTITKNLREGMSTEVKNAQALADTKGERGTPEWSKAYAEELAKLTSKNADTTVAQANGMNVLINKADGTVIKVLGRADADPYGIKGLQVMLAQQNIIQTNLENEKKLRELNADTKAKVTGATQGILQARNGISTAEAALKLAPGTFLGASTQNIFDKVPWTDAMALKDLVTTLKSGEVLRKLQEMKAQTATGASGLGAVSERELDLLISNMTALNPQSKDLQTQLKKVISGYKRLEASSLKDFEDVAKRPYDTGATEPSPTAAPATPNAGSRPALSSFMK